jgi:Spy/CpxP family protein refolding chaperone
MFRSRHFLATVPGSVVLLLLAAGAPAMPGGAGGAGVDRPDPAYARHAEQLRAEVERLGLDASQRQALQALGERFQVHGTDLRQRGEAIREQLLAVEPDNPRYDAVTEQASAASAALAADATRLAADFRAEVYAILTPEQRASIRERATARNKDWDAWRQRHQRPSRQSSSAAPP